MGQSKKEYLKGVERRITEDNSGKAIFIPQCNQCVYSSKRVYCKMYDKIPKEYREDKKPCPMFSIRRQ